MKQKPFFSTIHILLNMLILSLYRRMRKMPSTAVNFLDYPGSRANYHLDAFSPWRATMKLDKRIDESISLYGIRKYKGIDLYELPSHMLDTALLLIRDGIVDETNFTSDEPLSKIVESCGTDFVDRLGDDIWQHAMNDKKMDRLARKRSSSEEGYRKLHVKYASYLESIMRNDRFTNQIDEFIIQYGISTYLGISLYDFDNEAALNTAMKAIKARWRLQQVYFVLSFNGKELHELTKYELDNCELQLEDDDLTGIVIDEQKKALQQAQVQHLEKEQQKRDKHNAAARERRARKKALEEKAKQAIIEMNAARARERDAKKASKQPIKSTAKKSAVKAAPLKKIQPKKVVKKKAS